MDDASGGRRVSAAIAEAARQVGEISDTARLDAELLMADALGIAREAMLLGRMDDPVPAQFDELVARRLAHEPIAYILGYRDFWTIRLKIGPGVLIPRPDSETLIEAAVAHFAGTKGPRSILDLGTGSGALLLAALDQWPQATGFGIDASTEAVQIARENAAALGMGERVEIRLGDWRGDGRAHELVLCNPPYVATGEALGPEVAAHEPATALFAGVDGLDDYRRLAPLIGRQIADGGVACIEIGAGQAAAVTALFRGAGLGVALRRDIGGRDRCLAVTRVIRAPAKAGAQGHAG